MKRIGKILFAYWMKFAHVLGTINGYVILTLIYLVVLGLYAIPYRVWQMVSRKKTVTSFWQKKEHPSLDRDSITYQF